MNALREFFDGYSGDALALLGFFAALGAIVAGLIADRVMRERGFGIIGNGVLILMGVVVGLVISHSHFGVIRGAEPNRILIMAAASSTIVLVLCGTLKSYLFRVD